MFLKPNRSQSRSTLAKPQLSQEISLRLCRSMFVSVRTIRD